MMKPTESKLITSSFKNPKESVKTSKREFSPGSYAYSNKGEDRIMEKSGIYDIRFKRKDLREFQLRSYVTSEIQLQDVRDLKEIFDYYDSTRTGVLLPNDLKVLLSENGYEPSKQTVYETIAEYDQQETGGISFGQFMKAMTSKPHQKDTSRQIHHVFKKYDRKGKGYITMADLKEMNKLMNQKDDEEMLTLMLTRASKSNAKKVTYQEFYELMTKTVY